ncbi:MAG TPA: hypothetical protein VHZ03_00145 [Trebonia sp.]|nr:hypothetical protein [Trebonia sp.]
MEDVDEIGRASAAAVLASLGAAVVFEALTVPATQDTTVWAASPWKEDPYHTVVSLAQFAVPMLALVIALRLLAWRAPGGPDRAQQAVRAAGAMTALIELTLAFEWAAVIGRMRAWSWGPWTSVLVIGLVVASVLNVAVMALLVRCHRGRGSFGRWRHDWLGDVLFVCRRIPVLRRWASPDVAAWARRRAMTVFVVLSVLAGAVFTGFQAIGERWTDPLLIAWLLIVETTSNLAFCVISNGAAGFIARPPRTRLRRIAEASVVAGSLAILVVIAFHDALWQAFAAGPLTSEGLVALTLGAGLATSLVTAAVLLACVCRTTPPDRDDAASV